MTYCYDFPDFVKGGPKVRHVVSTGFLKRYMFKVLEEKSIKPCEGEWAVMYPFEVKEAFPSIRFEKKNYRKWYLVQVVRDETGLLNEVRVYSSTYAPVFRMKIELEKTAVVPENCRKWLISQDLPFPPDRLDLFGPVKG